MSGSGGPTPRAGNQLITILTPLKRGGSASLRLQFRLTRRFPSLKGLEQFRFVYYSQWCLVRSFHDNGPPQVRERPPRPLLLWEVVYSADADPYIEAFVLGIPRRLRALWGSSYGFPGTGSVARLNDYISAAWCREDLAYWAYPEATVRTILSGLEVAREHAVLLDVAEHGTEEDFDAAYAEFLTRRGTDL